MYGMDYLYYSLPSPKETSSSSGDSGRLSRQAQPVPNPNKIPFVDTGNDKNAVAALFVNKETEQYNLLREKLRQIGSDLFEFKKGNTATVNTPAQSEKAEKLRKNLKLLESPDFNEIPDWPNALKTDISKTLIEYDQNKLKKERELKIYFTPSTAPIKTTDLITIEKLALPKNITNNPLNYPHLKNPIAQAITDINFAVVEKSENGLIRAITNFKQSNQNFIIKNMDFFRINKPNDPLLNQLKINILNHYILKLSQPYIKHEILDTIPAINTILSELCKSIPLFLDTINQEEISQNPSSELIQLNTNDLLMILQYLQQKDESLTPNISLVKDIVLETKLNENSKKACLLLLNKLGNFYPQMQSDLTNTIIDDIAINYFKLSGNSLSQEQKIGFITQVIEWLAIISSFNPPLSEKLLISNIADDQLQDYISKIQLLELNCNPSLLTKQKLQELQTKIFQEAHIRPKRANVAKWQTKKEELEIAKKLRAEEIAKLQAREKDLNAKKIIYTTDIPRLKAEEKLHREEIAKLQAREKDLNAKKIIYTTDISRLKAEEKLHREEIAKLQAEEERLKAKEIAQRNAQKRLDESQPKRNPYNNAADEEGKTQRAPELVTEYSQEKNELNTKIPAKEIPESPQQPIQKTSSFFETIQSWFEWLFWGPL
jgi:hypothetical protein